jgi:thioredoxin-related protein
LLWQAVLVGSGFTLVDRDTVESQEKELAALQRENDELFEDLFSPQIAARFVEEHGELPYDEQADAKQEVATARAKALAEQKFLMVTFGANWCLDCRTLSRILKGKELSAYTGERFNFINVDVGKFNRNTEVAAELGVSLERGIPVAVFFDTGGNVIGTTNKGELEPSRRYTSKQILKFVRDIVERSLVLAPDAVE